MTTLMASSLTALPARSYRFKARVVTDISTFVPGWLEGLMQSFFFWRELRAACAKRGVIYPEGAEKEMQDYYRRKLGINIKSV